MAPNIWFDDNIFQSHENSGYAMNCVAKIFLQILFLSLVSLNVVIADSGPAVEMKLFVDSFNKQDAATVASLFHEDGKLLPAGEPVVTGTEAIQDFWQGAYDAGLSKIEKTVIEFIVSGDLAVETSSYIVTFNEAEISGKDTLVWRKDSEGKWKISTDIWARNE